MTDALIRVRGMRQSLSDLNARPLFGRTPQIEILKGLDFDIPRGQVLGIVGESGSGKSTLGRCLVRLLEPTGGSIAFDGTDITHLSPGALGPLRRNLQMIFQDPMSSLNPRHSVLRLIAGPMRLHGIADANAKARAVLDRVRLGRSFADRFPHQLSGGQRQRVGIARALALGPSFILADEIISGLDVSTQAQIIQLLEEIVAEMNLTMAFISHDLSVVRRLCRQLIVLREGEIVEAGQTAQIFDAPQHPYTLALRDAIPLPERDDGWLDAP
jgi:ABC-type oligopeptide transport system ATPase subunit